MTLPDWIPEQAFEDFLLMRKKMKKAPTERAIELLIIRLAAMAEAGQDVKAVLEQSTMNSWIGVFEVREERRSQPRPGQHPAMSALGKFGQATANNAQDWLEEQ